MFSIPAANVADRFSKRSVIITLKLGELALMLVGLASLRAAPQNLTVPFLVLVGMGAQSAFFSPAKYGILPQLVSHRDLSHANGLLALFSIIAIVGGTVVMGSVVPGIGIRDGNWDGPLWYASGLLAAFSAIGLVAALWIPRVPAGRECHRRPRVVAPRVEGRAPEARALADDPRAVVLLGDRELPRSRRHREGAGAHRERAAGRRARLDAQQRRPAGVFRVRRRRRKRAGGRISAGKVEYG